MGAGEVVLRLPTEQAAQAANMQHSESPIVVYHLVVDHMYTPFDLVSTEHPCMIPLYSVTFIFSQLNRIILHEYIRGLIM